jgi:polyisoprenoid-binding protein YceI
MKTSSTIAMWAAVLATSLLTINANAVEYKSIDTAKSNVAFSYKQMGVGMDGKFKKFAAQLNFDPSKTAAAKVNLEIDLTSIDTGSSEADQEVTGKSWFNTNVFPKAVFVSSQIKQTAANQFEVAGKLTIKGQTKDISFPLKQTSQGNVGVFNGSFVMRRADFNIGEGMWAKFDTVANEVQVNFQITALASK